jgi:hypothetical protein
MKCYNDIEYSDEDKLQKLDIYTTGANNSLLPVLIYIHGGAWSFGDKSDIKKHTSFYTNYGIIFVSINYRLSSLHNDIKHPTHVEDCAKAVSWIFNNIKKYGGDKKNLYLSGHSSVAHLASLLSTDGKYLKKHSISPIEIRGTIAVDTSAFNLNSYSYINESANKKMQEMKEIVKRIFTCDEQKLLEASPINYAHQETCLNFLVAISSNRPLAIKVSNNFVSRLKNSIRMQN